MPLTRATVTVASRKMLPTYPIFALWLGLIYAVDPGTRLAGSPAFPLLPIAVWGGGFIFSGLVLGASLIGQFRDLYVYALAPLMVWCAVWTVMLAWAAVFDGGSFSAPALPAFVARACWATMLSLLAEER